MSLREKLNRTPPNDRRRRLFERFGIVENPFPAAGQPTGHPRYDESDADSKVVSAIQEFEGDHKTQVLVIEGTQGVGKTNLLNYYQEQLDDLYHADSTFYIIRYYPDPEPTFDAIVRRVFQELGASHLAKIGQELASYDDSAAEEIIEDARGHEVRMVLLRLRQAASNEVVLQDVSNNAIEWLVGLRLLNRHKDRLGVQFRLDTVESKTQALRDIVYVSEKLDLLRGIFLLLDELEKQDYSQSKTAVLRYLSAIRALIDALPRRLFLMLALTSEARRRYFAMLPAFASRLQHHRVVLSPLQEQNEAVRLADFYISSARDAAKSVGDLNHWTAGTTVLLTDTKIKDLFSKALKYSADRGFEGVVHRDFLNILRSQAESAMSRWLTQTSEE